MFVPVNALFPAFVTYPLKSTVPQRASQADPSHTKFVPAGYVLYAATTFQTSHVLFHVLGRSAYVGLLPFTLYTDQRACIASYTASLVTALFESSVTTLSIFTIQYVEAHADGNVIVLAEAWFVVNVPIVVVVSGDFNVTVVFFIAQSTYVFVVKSEAFAGVTVEVGSFVLNVLVPVNAFVQFVIAIFVNATAPVCAAPPFKDTLDTHVSNAQIASYTAPEVTRFVLSSVTVVSVGRSSEELEVWFAVNVTVSITVFPFLRLIVRLPSGKVKSTPPNLNFLITVMILVSYDIKNCAVCCRAFVCCVYCPSVNVSFCY